MYKQIGRTQFNVENVKKMTITQFKKAYDKHNFPKDIEEVYEELTGKKQRSSKKED